MNKSLIVILTVCIVILASYASYYKLALKNAENSLLPLNEKTIFEQTSSEEDYECPVEFKLPAKPVNADEYPQKEFWSVRGSASSRLISKIGSYNQVSAMYATTDDASDSIAKYITIGCSKNDNRYTDNKSFMDNLNNSLDAYNKSTDMSIKQMEAETYIIKSAVPTERWGYKVMDLIVNQYNTTKNYTVFVTPQYIYEISIGGYSTDADLENQAQEIFNALSFEK